jgi:hypothetical protein
MTDDEKLAAYGAALADAIEAALPGWVERRVQHVLTAWAAVSNHQADPAVTDAARAAGQAAVIELLPRLRALLALDVDDQCTTPMAIVREAVRYPTEVLRSAGVPPVERDQLATEQFPDDDYNLAPATFADLSPDVHEPGLVWGAAKAHVVIARHRPS